MVNKEKINGIIVESLPNGYFKVKLDDEEEVRAYVSGKIRINKIKILTGDSVVVELDEYRNIGRIIYRN